jgi:hypothetical protein
MTCNSNVNIRRTVKHGNKTIVNGYRNRFVNEYDDDNNDDYDDYENEKFEYYFMCLVYVPQYIRK